MNSKEEYNKQNNYSKQKGVLDEHEAKLKPLRKVMRGYSEVLGMTNMPTPPNSPSWSLSQDNQIELRTGNAQSTQTHPKE